MQLYFAPLEGIGSYIYRNVHHEFFSGCDAYYAPFIYPTDTERISAKHLKDILPENNRDIKLMVQILSNNPSPSLRFAEKIKLFGYDEMNINLGCPYPMVAKKGRGAGFLANPAALEIYLEQLYSGTDIKLTLKTRTGYSSHSELAGLMNIFNKYEMPRLIVHPRTRDEMYKGIPNMEAFSYAYNNSANKLCYNGNIYTKADYERIAAEYPELEGVMIGRGILTNPALFREIRGGAPLATDELRAFTRRLGELYYDKLKSETFTLHKLKEVWRYMLANYPEEKKTAKRLKKSDSLTDFYSALESLPNL